MKRLRVIYYSHGLNTARFVHLHLLPEIGRAVPVCGHLGREAVL